MTDWGDLARVIGLMLLIGFVGLAVEMESFSSAWREIGAHLVRVGAIAAIAFVAWLFWRYVVKRGGRP